ncbi:MAG: choline-sulfatase [Cognaticolwellia sp.]|jgi:choline-sulfatase
MSLLLWLACTGMEPTPSNAVPKPSLLLVTLDTTRADALGAYGHAGAKTPNFDAMADAGVRFDRAYATVPLTTPSHASMLTGLYPTRHGIHNNGDAILKEEVDTLAEILKGEGYRSAASVSAFVTTATWNLDQGFDAYFDDVRRSKGSRWEYERPADEVVSDLETWLPTGEEPFFAWAHFYDAHGPYEDRDDFQLATPYDEEIAFVDTQLGRLIESAKAQAGPGGLAVILVADHGEAFGEHGENGHGLFLYDATMRIPFVIVPPQALSTGVAVDQAVSNVDVMPTALGLLGLTPPADLDGRDLSGATSGSLMPRGPVYLESELASQRFGFHPELAIADQAMKLFDTPSALLFDLAMDPGELQDVSAGHPETVARLHAFREEVWAARESGQAAAMSPELMEQLAALGYVGGAAVDVDLSTAPDAKDMGAVIRSVEGAKQLLDAGKYAEAINVFNAILVDQPHLGEVLTGLARAQMALGKDAEAEATYRRAIELQPSSTVLRSNLAQALAAQGRLQEGYDLMASIHQQVPGDELARAGMLKMAIDLDRHQEAVNMGLAWLKEDPEQRTTQAFTGIALVHLGQLDQGKALLQASLIDGQPRQLVHMALARVAQAQKEQATARGHYEAELAWFPQNKSVRRELASLCMSTQDWACARDNYAKLAEMAPEGPPAALRLMWAQALFNLKEYEQARAVLNPALKKNPGAALLLLHANLLAKEGKGEEGKQVFEKAQALKVIEVEAARKAAKARANKEPAGPKVPGPSKAPQAP